MISYNKNTVPKCSTIQLDYCLFLKDYRSKIVVSAVHHYDEQIKHWDIRQSPKPRIYWYTLHTFARMLDC